MVSREDCGPFILRFSKSMYRPNPRKYTGGAPRTASGKSIDTASCSDNLRSGFHFYKSFSFNKHYPVYAGLTLKPGSMAKSLRYHFFRVTGTVPSASISENTLVLPLENENSLNMLTGMLTHSRNSSFRASLSHLENLNVISVENKAECLKNPALQRSGRVFIRLFPFSGSLDPFMNFLTQQLNIAGTKLTDICGTLYLIAEKSRLSDRYENLFSHSLVQSVNPEPEIFLYEQYTRHNSLPLECVKTRELHKTYPKAGVVDSGVAESSFLKEWEMETVSFVDKADRDHRHGTFVCGRMLEQNETFGGILFLNVEIIPADGRLSLSCFARHMEEVLKNYHRSVKIYNISLGTECSTQDSFSPVAAVLDSLQYRYGVLFVVSAGNSEITEIPDKISTSGESVNSLTVGSVAHIDTNIQTRLSPSFFTRKGPGPGGFIKPEVASFGGAHEKRYGRLRPVGVFSIGTRNELAEDCGTSHAAPIVTAAAAKLLHKYSHAFRHTDIVKAMIIHYTFLNSRDNPPCPFKGFGVMPDSLEGDGTDATYIHEGKTPSEGIIELTDIPLPADMFENGKASGEIVLTLSYKADTDLDFPHFYTLFKLEASLGYYKNGRWTSILTSKDAVGRPASKDNFEKFMWAPSKILRRNIKEKSIPLTLSLRLMASRRDFYSKKPEIPYGIVISFISREKNLYQCLRKMRDKNSLILEHSSELWKTCGENSTKTEQ